MSFEDHIRKNKEAFKVKDIPLDLWDKINEQLEIPRAKKSGNTKRLIMTISSIAAIGLICVFFYQNYQANKVIKQELIAMKSAMSSLLKDQSSFKRIRAVNMSSDFRSADQDVINALIKTMNSDENKNVQLAAVNALENFTDNEMVKTALLNTLDNAEEPFLKIKIINTLSNIKETRAIPFLNQIIDDKASQGYLKEEAINAMNEIKSL